MRVKLIWIVVLLGLALMGLGCGGGRAVSGGKTGKATKTKVRGDRTRISHSEGVEPLWIQECPARTDHLLPFCGESHKMVSQKMACTAATADAIGKLRRFIGQKVSAKLEPDGQGGYQFSMAGTESEAVTIRGAWESERWVWVSVCLWTIRPRRTSIVFSQTLLHNNAFVWPIWPRST